MTEKEVKNKLDMFSEAVYQVDNLCELWDDIDEDEWNYVQEYGYVLECDTGILYRIINNPL